MDDDGKPSWLSSSNNANAASSTTPMSATSTAPGSTPPYYSLVSWTIAIINIGLMFFMAFTGVAGILSSNNVDDTGVVFVGSYLLIFAAIEFFYELSQIIKIQALDILMKKNFGFLYGINGRGLYFMFVGILCFGLSTPRGMAIGCGVAIAFWGLFLIVVALLKPDYFPKLEKFVPP